MGQLVKSAAGRARSVPVRARYLFLLATVCGGSFLVLSISSSPFFAFQNEVSLSHSTHQYNEIDQTSLFTIKTKGCTIPGLDPYHESIKRFIKRPDEVVCPRSNISLLNNNSTHIWIEMEHLQYYEIDIESNFSCCYKSFYRPSAIVDVTAKNADDRVQYKPCIYFSSYIEAMHEFVKVSCGTEFGLLYEEFFLFAPLKQSAGQSDYLGYNIHRNMSATSLNVIVMGIDAISRLNFYRTMPRTLALLKKKGAVELLGYNKVGDNTFPNLTPMLLGLRDTELKKTCWPNFKSRFDSCPFIWEWYKEAGYLTALGEDSGKLGTFNFGKFGFLNTPTDYYIRTFIREAETRVGNTKDYNTFVCMGNKLFYKVLLDYIQFLTTTLKSSRLFGFFWEVTLSHDFLNYPMLMDKHYEALLKYLEDMKYLDETVLILLSDHGMRWGDIRGTKQGRLEERLPFVHILMPPSFKQNYSLAYNNLKTNSRRLTTPFDIHATLFDLLNLEKLTDESIKTRSKTEYANDRSISLFLRLPNNRTCQMADIDDHWCTCHKNTKLTTDCPEVQEAAMKLIRNINNMIRDYPQCSRLVLADIIDASEMLVGTTQKDEEGWREILVVIRTSPGDAVFEATLRHDSSEWVLAGTVSRLNLYGDQSHCVNNFQLKLYCYCS